MERPVMVRGRRPVGEESMQQDVERFLQVLESERGFSVNTIFAYRNDLTQFLAFLRGESIDDGGRDPSEMLDGDDSGRRTSLSPVILQWDQLTDDDLTSYLLFLRSRK